ncbi:sensor domain-containing protein, partial [Mycobacterium sp. 852002-50816_SCH5313054-b]|uniref:sensor domain-containing protein n=1 Tax=Mycobacterium sp. 852002-50816_SCH5313054-b TaxID=1834092 RepID=UPI000A5FFBCE
TAPRSGPMPQAAQTPRPWAPHSGPVPSGPQAYQGGSGDWGGPPPAQFTGPASWNQPAPKPKRNPWPIVAAVVALVVLAGGGVGIWLVTRPAPAPPPPDPIPPGRLSALLLDPSGINTIMGSSTMTPGKPITSTDTSTVTLSLPNCLGSLYTSQDPVYAGTGYTGISGLVSSEPGDDYDHWVNQAAAAFPSADKAKAFLQASADKWKACSGKTVTVTNKTKTFRWTFAQLNGGPPKITMLETQEGADGWECQRAMGVANNVVADVNACGYHISDQGGQVIDKILAKVENE